MKNKTLYHGSLIHDLKVIEAFNGKSPDKKDIKRVFAAKDKIYAILNTHKDTLDSPDKYIKHGFYINNGIRSNWVLEELVLNGLDLYKTPASIYTLSSNTFDDVKNGIIGEEFVSYENVNVIFEEKINNVYEELVKLEQQNKIVIKRFNCDKSLKYDPPMSVEDIKNKKIDFLLKDPIHKWRAETGIELIHKEPSLEELERIWNNWQLMSDEQKKLSDNQSFKFFGLSNESHYNHLKNNEYMLKINDK